MALVYNSADGSLKFYINGTMYTINASSTVLPASWSYSWLNSLVIGWDGEATSAKTQCYVSNVRISNSARYTAAFTALSSAALTADVNTVFLNSFDQASGTNYIGTQLYPSIPCLCAGMLIRTPNGETPIEKLRIGDLVTTHDGRDVPIVDYTRTVVRGDYYNIPFRIPASHFDPGYPSKDILLSPNHMFFCGGWKVPAQTKGLPDETALLGKEFEYFNIALPNYGEDKLSCHGIGVDSWNTRAKLMY
jgi:hypothetical protein